LVLSLRLWKLGSDRAGVGVAAEPARHHDIASTPTGRRAASGPGGSVGHQDGPTGQRWPDEPADPANPVQIGSGRRWRAVPAEWPAVSMLAWVTGTSVMTLVAFPSNQRARHAVPGDQNHPASGAGTPRGVTSDDKEVLRCPIMPAFRASSTTRGDRAAGDHGAEADTGAGRVGRA
jgi:hypothetical protein